MRSVNHDSTKTSPKLRQGASGAAECYGQETDIQPVGRRKLTSPGLILTELLVPEGFTPYQYASFYLMCDSLSRRLDSIPTDDPVGVARLLRVFARETLRLMPALSVRTLEAAQALSACEHGQRILERARAMARGESPPPASSDDVKVGEREFHEAMQWTRRRAKGNRDRPRQP